MNLKTTFFIAIVLSTIAITSWELFWRSKGLIPTINDDKPLWALHRATVEKAGDDEVIIIGSSRAYFDIQLNEWEQVTGKKPIQLSSTGSSPLPIFHDLVHNTNFKGTIVVGVTPGLFFSTTYPEAFPWKRPQSKVDFYNSQTYAQKINFFTSIPLQQNFVFMSADEEEWADDIDLKSLLRRISIGNRNGQILPPPFYSFGNVTYSRNMSMIDRVPLDTAFANSIIKVWEYFGKGAPPPDKEATMNYFLKDVKLFKERGGNLILLRCPSSGFYTEVESKFFPRNEYWDELAKQSNAKSYHFEDYEQLKYFKCPEFSHLSNTDAAIFTSELAKIMMNDKALSNQKNN